MNKDKFRLKLTREPYPVSDHILFLGEIPSYNNFERNHPIGMMKKDGKESEDYIPDDSALVHKGAHGLFIITGCSHSGICNIMEHAKNVCKEQRIAGVLGGFHLMDISDQLHKTIAYMAANNVQALYPCHCISFAAKAEMNKYIPIREAGVGLQINVDS